MRADLFPQIGLSADGTYQDAPTNAGFAGAIGGGGVQSAGSPSLFPDRFQYDTWTVALGFSYEIDFWGKYRNETKAAISDFLASEGDYQTARLAVISATVSTYAEIVALRRQVELTTFSVDILRERAELTNERYYSGLVTTFELYTIQSLYRNTEATLPVLESLYEEAKGRLSILLGRYAGTIDGLLGEDEAPAVVLDPVPSDLTAALLEQRPDVVRVAAHGGGEVPYRIQEGPTVPADSAGRDRGTASRFVRGSVPGGPVLLQPGGRTAATDLPGWPPAGQRRRGRGAVPGRRPPTTCAPC